jgi:hypothetical protein
MQGAIDAGFVLQQFQEPMTRVPYFLFMRWRKASRADPGGPALGTQT